MRNNINGVCTVLFQDTANALGYDTTTNDNLWKDRVNVELTLAVLDSYKKSGVTIVDHHNLVNKTLGMNFEVFSVILKYMYKLGCSIHGLFQSRASSPRWMSSGLGLGDTSYVQWNHTNISSRNAQLSPITIL